ncbi:MAG: CBS domain-containing protein [Deltaproteobacteria bacterium]|nr:CBS domain-containing protein [Deltaproteobacteria bacterium]
MNRAVRTVEPGTSVGEVARVMVLNRIAGVFVTEGGRLLGVVSEKDILRALYPSYMEFVDTPESHMDFEEMEERYNEIKGLRAERLMTKTIVSVTPETPILRAASLMVLHKVRRLPVLEADGGVVGVVSQGDVHMAVFERQFLR